MLLDYSRSDKINSSFSNNASFSFKKKNARIDWRKIASVDLDSIIRDMNIALLQENIDHLTFCNIEAEIDSKLIDPNYIKLFKMGQLVIEYLMHSQNYLTDVISTIEAQLNKSLTDVDEYKKSCDKLQKELAELKKENKKRKKMLEAQQAMINKTPETSNSCPYCPKSFLNISFLQAHITRRHFENVQTPIAIKPSPELERELEQIKERLKKAENDLSAERNARLSMSVSPVSNQLETNSQFNAELKKYKDEIKRLKETFKKETEELHARNLSSEAMISDLKERLGGKSNIGWIKDDIDVEKDTVLKQKQEIERLTQLIKEYEIQLDDQKTRFKNKEASMKSKHNKELEAKENEIESLRLRIKELEKSIGKSDDELRIQYNNLLKKLEDEQRKVYSLDQELIKAKKEPPPITPRQQSQVSRSPSPKKIEQQPVQQPAPRLAKPVNANNYGVSIYLHEYCKLTLKEIQKNPNLLAKFKKAAISNFNEELHNIGINPNEKGLSDADFKLKMKDLANFRDETIEDLPIFSEIRERFSDICDKNALNKLNSSLRSTGARVTFKKDLELASNLLPQIVTQKENSNRKYNDAEETEEDVTLSNALESEDDTEPTKSGINDLSQSQLSNSQTSQMNSARRRKKNNLLSQDEISDLESISQLLSERSVTRRKTASNQMTSSKKPEPKTNLKAEVSSVSEKKKLIEAQLEKSARNPTKPSPNAVPAGFQNQSSSQINMKRENSFSSVSDLENEVPPNQRPRSGFRSSLQDSISSSIWVSETNDLLDKNPNMNKINESERPPTANSLKTSNYDSDEAYYNH